MWEVAEAALGFGVLGWVQLQPLLLLSVPRQVPAFLKSLSPPLYDGHNRTFFLLRGLNEMFSGQDLTCPDT